MSSLKTYLPGGLPSPVVENDGIDKPYWEGTRRGELMVQRCTKCGTFRWGPEWSCHKCLSFDFDWQKVSGRGRIYSWERPWGRGGRGGGRGGGGKGRGGRRGGGEGGRGGGEGGESGK